MTEFSCLSARNERMSDWAHEWMDEWIWMVVEEAIKRDRFGSIISATFLFQQGKRQSSSRELGRNANCPRKSRCSNNVRRFLSDQSVEMEGGSNVWWVSKRQHELRCTEFLLWLVTCSVVDSIRTWKSKGQDLLCDGCRLEQADNVADGTASTYLHNEMQCVTDDSNSHIHIVRHVSKWKNLLAYVIEHRFTWTLHNQPTCKVISDGRHISVQGWRPGLRQHPISTYSVTVSLLQRKLAEGYGWADPSRTTSEFNQWRVVIRCPL